MTIIHIKPFLFKQKNHSVVCTHFPTVKFSYYEEFQAPI